MRILVLNYEFPPIGGGGGHASAALSAALAERGHELRVMTSRAPQLAQEELIDGYQVSRILTGRRSRYRASFASMAGYVLAGLLPGLKAVRSWKPSVIHAHFAVPTGVLALRLSRLTGVPYVLTAHLGDVPGGVPEKTDAWFRAIYPFTPPIWKQAAQVVAVSEYTRRLAQPHYDVDIKVIPNGISLPSSEQVSSTVPDPPRIIFAGRFQPQKNLALLVDLLDRVRDMKWQCELLGDGPDRKAVAQQIRSRGLEERIRLLGWVDSRTVDRHLLASDLLLLPSRSEGFPVVVVQALASGLAVFASETGGLRDLVEPSLNGMLCAVDDLNCFEQALRACLGEPRRLAAMKRASRERAHRFDIRHISKEYERVLERAAQVGV